MKSLRWAGVEVSLNYFLSVLKHCTTFKQETALVTSGHNSVSLKKTTLFTCTVLCFFYKMICFCHELSRKRDAYLARTSFYS